MEHFFIVDVKQVVKKQLCSLLANLIQSIFLINALSWHPGSPRCYNEFVRNFHLSAHLNMTVNAAQVIRCPLCSDVLHILFYLSLTMDKTVSIIAISFNVESEVQRRAVICPGLTAA